MIPIFEPKDIAYLKERLETPQNIVIIAHVTPDGDALGSTLALSDVLIQLGHTTTVVYPTIYGSTFSWMPKIEETIIGKEDPERAKALLMNADIIFCLDFNEPKRVEELADTLVSSPAFKVLIDHHLHPAPFVDIAFSFPKISSTSLLLYHLIVALGWEECITQMVAESIFTGMVTDTGNFSYNSEDPDIYTTISQLLEKGIRKDYINDKINRNYSIDRVKLNAYLLNNKLSFLPEYKAAIITISMKEKQEFNYQVGDTEGIVNEPLAAKDIEFSIFLHEMSKYTKISLRSKGDFPVNEFAEKFFNGGGHCNASGAEVYDNLKNTYDLVLAALRVMHP